MSCVRKVEHGLPYDAVGQLRGGSLIQDLRTGGGHPLSGGPSLNPCTQLPILCGSLANAIRQSPANVTNLPAKPGDEEGGFNDPTPHSPRLPKIGESTQDVAGSSLESHL